MVNDLIIDEHFGELIESLDLKYPDSGPPPMPLADWAQKAPVILDGKPFTFRRHEYLIEPYNNNHQHIVEEKAAQMGLTSKAMVRLTYKARYGGYRGILYLFPSKSDVTDFSKGRIDPLIEDNPGTIGKWIRDTDAANIKRIWNSFLYLRGMHSRIGLKSVPADLIIFDELDEAPQNAVDMAMERMSHSEIREVLKLSNPTLPGYGIDKAFQETDMRYWLLKCQKCGEYTCLEDEFPNCLLRLGDTVIRACKSCKSELDPAVGEWVAKRPEIKDKRGYHYSQLFSQFVSPAEILRQFETTDNLTDFYNLKIGIAYVEAENRLSPSDLRACCGVEPMLTSHFGPCFMGIDVGTLLHVVIGVNPSSFSKEILYMGRLSSFNDVHDLAKRFNVGSCVIDALPETRKAREFQQAEKFQTFLCYYNENQKGSSAWDSKKGIVQMNRTENMDAIHHRVTTPGAFILPRSGPQELEIYITQMCNLAKVLEEDEETGSRKYVYRTLGPDHYRHATAYALLASDRVGTVDHRRNRRGKKRDSWDDEWNREDGSRSWMAA
jgi:hypothetical protein